MDSAQPRTFFRAPTESGGAPRACDARSKSRTAQREFIWATGIEDTFVATPHPKTGRLLDEYALTEHYERWEEDLKLVADLGVSAVRYGIPWYRVNPRPGVWDWGWTDRVLERLVRTHAIRPIVDLVHYGAPLWMEKVFLDADYPQRVAEYAAVFARRYSELVSWYTPLNEPRIHAWYAAFLGWWPPYARGWPSFARGLTSLCRGICLTQRLIAEVQPEATFVHVDATDYYVPAAPQDAQLIKTAELRQAIVFLALDLVLGQVNENHGLYQWLIRRGLSEADLNWFRYNAVRPDIIGYNMYPMFSYKQIGRTLRGTPVARIRPCWTQTLAELTRMYANRYAPIPLMITETAARGTMKKRIRWIDDSVQLVRHMRASGIPLVGYTFWPLFSLFAWAYQRGGREIVEYKLDMGLYDLKPGPNGWERVATRAVDAFRQAINQPLTG